MLFLHTVHTTTPTSTSGQALAVGAKMAPGCPQAAAECHTHDQLTFTTFHCDHSLPCPSGEKRLCVGGLRVCAEI